MSLHRAPILALLVPMAIGFGLPPQARIAAAQAPPADEAPAGRIGLDQLLKLPDSLDFGVERRGGRTRIEWRALFEEAQQSVDDAKHGLSDAQARLATVAGRSDNWSMAPPGMPIETVEDNPDTRALREEVARWRGEIVRAEARQREVTIEASLAGVPEDWRRSGLPAGSDDVSGPPSEHRP